MIGCGVIEINEKANEWLFVELTKDETTLLLNIIHSRYSAKKSI